MILYHDTSHFWEEITEIDTMYNITNLTLNTKICRDWQQLIKKQQQSMATEIMTTKQKSNC